LLYWRDVRLLLVLLPTEVGETDVGDADGLGLARCEQLLHLLPYVDVVVRADDVALAVGELGEAVVVA
jgi:hypothetical protein